MTYPIEMHNMTQVNKLNKRLVVKTSHNNGFTLVELSVVLVIIGLIIGGIMTGRDLLKSSIIRAQISQIENYTYAVSAFSDKYANLPGDITPDIATPAGMTVRSGATDHGDGDGQVAASCAIGENFGCESALFWSDLSHEKLIKENFTAATDGSVTAGADTVEDYLPRGKIKGSLLMARWYTQLQSNTFRFFNASTYAAGVETGAGASSTPQEASSIDMKMDDGKPLTGLVMASITGVGLPAAAGVCVTDDPGNPYNTAVEKYATNRNCTIWFKFE